MEGYYCPEQSHISTQRECGGPAVFCPHGSGNPTAVREGYFSSVAGPAPVLKHVELSTIQWSNWTELIFPPVLRTLADNEKRTRKFVIVEDPDSTQRTRTREILCPPGNYCDQGIRYLCPAGTYGNVEGLPQRAQA